MGGCAARARPARPSDAGKAAGLEAQQGGVLGGLPPKVTNRHSKDLVVTKKFI